MTQLKGDCGNALNVAQGANIAGISVIGAIYIDVRENRGSTIARSHARISDNNMVPSSRDHISITALIVIAAYNSSKAQASSAVVIQANLATSGEVSGSSDGENRVIPCPCIYIHPKRHTICFGAAGGGRSYKRVPVTGSFTAGRSIIIRPVEEIGFANQWWGEIEWEASAGC